MKTNVQYAESYGYLRVIEGGLSTENEIYKKNTDYQNIHFSLCRFVKKGIIILFKCTLTAVWAVLLFTGGNLGLLAVAAGIIFLIVTSIF